MGVAEQAQLIVVAFVVGYLVIVFQTITLMRLFRSRAWYFIGAAFVVLCSGVVWAFIRLPAQILNAQAMGTMPASFTTEQWVKTGWAFLAVVLFFLGLDRMRRDFALLEGEPVRHPPFNVTK